MVPEQMFTTNPYDPIQGVSTMKALQLANQQGQKIYTITQANAGTILPTLAHSSATMSDITAAINAGYTVTTHESPINVPGWTGSGYIIVDQHGNGMYMISGGMNGAFALFASMLLASIGGFAGGYSTGYAERPPYVNVRTARLAQIFGRISGYAAWAGVIATIAVVAFDDSLTLEQKIQQILLSILSAVMSSLIVTYAASAMLFTPLGLIFFGVYAAVILALAFTVIASEYFSFNQRMRNEWKYV